MLSTIQEHALTLTAFAGAVMATALVALLGSGPQIPVRAATPTDPLVDRPSDG